MLVDQLREAIPHQTQRHGLASESSLRVAAAMLANAAAREMTATRVVGTLGRDDADEFQEVVARIGDEYDLESHFELLAGSFSVRFWRA